MTLKLVDRDTICVESLYGYKTKKGLVQLTWGLEACQMTPAEARAHALLILAAAEAAEQDELTYGVLAPKLGPGGALSVLVEMRRQRGQPDHARPLADPPAGGG